MSAADHLNEQQFMSVEELKNVRSGDFPGRTVGNMKGTWLADSHAQPRDAHKGHGGPQGYVDHLANSIKAHGVQEPLTIIDYTPVDGVKHPSLLYQGHHRALAAMQAGATHVPVERWSSDSNGKWPVQ